MMDSSLFLYKTIYISLWVIEKIKVIGKPCKRHNFEGHVLFIALSVVYTIVARTSMAAM